MNTLLAHDFGHLNDNVSLHGLVWHVGLVGTSLVCRGRMTGVDPGAGLAAPVSGVVTGC